jgi:hypothetical protein
MTEDALALAIGRAVLQAALGLGGRGQLTVHVRGDGRPAAIEIARRETLDLTKVLDALETSATQ